MTELQLTEQSDSLLFKVPRDPKQPHYITEAFDRKLRSSRQRSKADRYILLVERRDGCLEVCAPVEGQVRVALIDTDRAASRFDDALRDRQVGIEVLEPEDLRIVAGGLGYLVDPEARDLRQPSRASHSAKLIERHGACES